MTGSIIQKYLEPHLWQAFQETSVRELKYEIADVAMNNAQEINLEDAEFIKNYLETI